jgi:hypothetical protein
MYLKSAVAYLRGAAPSDPIDAHMEPIRRTLGRRGAPLSHEFESGHGIWFWSQALLHERTRLGRTTSYRLHRSLLTTCATLYANWFVAMRYRPGHAPQENALSFLATVEWLKSNHAALRI